MADYDLHPGLNASRAVQIIVGDGSRGSGYHVSGSLILTAAHVLRGAQTATVHIDPDRPGGERLPGEVIWQNDHMDLAVVLLTGIMAIALSPVEFARLGEHGDNRAAQALGFPRFKIKSDPPSPDGEIARYRDSAHAYGSINLHSNRRERTLEFLVESPPPYGDRPNVSPWEGMSGAAVWMAHRIVGVVSRNYPSDGAGRLTVARIDRAYEILPPEQLAELRRLLNLPLAQDDLVDVLQVQDSPRLTGRVVANLFHGFTDAVGREGLVRQLAEHFTAARQGTSPAVQVLSGLGGVGKTTIARVYGDRYRKAYDLQWWVRAADPPAIPGEFRALLNALEPGSGASVADPVDAALSLLGRRPGRWLLVFDDVAGLDELMGLVPAAGNGDVLVTSRATHWPKTHTVTRVEPLAAHEAVRLLTDISEDPDPVSAARLADELGYLPLALTQAAYYIRADELGITLADYLTGYHRRRADLHAYKSLVPDYHATVANVWDLAFDRLSAEAKALLELVTWYAPQSVPVMEILTAPGAIASLPPVGENAGRRALLSLLEDDLLRRSAARELASFSLISAAGRGEVHVHRLVQAVSEDRLRTDGMAGSRSVEAAALLLLALPTSAGTQKGIDAWLRLQAHARTLCDHLPHKSAYGLRLRRAIANWTGYLSKDQQARDLLTELARDYADAFGDTHRETLEVELAAAWWTGSAGDRSAARTLTSELAASMSVALGPADPLTLAARDNCARWTGEAGDPVAARDLYRALLPDMIEALGPADRITLVGEDGLARWTGEAGDPAAARDSYAVLFERTAEALGRDHQQTLRCRACLGWWTGEAGDPQAARELYSQLLEDAINYLGRDHRDVWGTREGMAHWIGKAGDPRGAYDLYTLVAAHAEEVAGPDHSDAQAARRGAELWAPEGQAPGQPTVLQPSSSRDGRVRVKFSVCARRRVAGLARLWCGLAGSCGPAGGVG